MDNANYPNKKLNEISFLPLYLLLFPAKVAIFEFTKVNIIVMYVLIERLIPEWPTTDGEQLELKGLVWVTGWKKYSVSTGTLQLLAH